MQRLCLAPLRLASWLYGGVAALLRAARESGWLRRERLGCLVVSVGNLSVGGSAKTPLAARVALSLKGAGFSTALLSRGYGRRSPGQTRLVSGGRGGSGDVALSGDEPEWLGSKASGIPVWVAANRIDAGRNSIIHFGTQVAVLDDGFQHTRLHRDIEVVAIDGVSGFGNGAVLPRGPLREPAAALRYADAVVVVDGPLHPEDEARVLQWAPLAHRFNARRTPARLYPLGAGEPKSLAALRGAPLGMLCGIAQPASFRRTLEGLGARIAAERLFPDHHAYRWQDLRALEETASLWVTTEKDALKLDNAWCSGCEVWVLGIEVEIDDGARFDAWLHDTAGRNSERALRRVG